MKNLLHYIEKHYVLKDPDIHLLKQCFKIDDLPPRSKLLKAGMTERYLYFLDKGIIKGYQNVDGKLVVQHLIAESEFFTSLDSYMSGTPSADYFETITQSRVFKLSRPDFELLQNKITFWNDFVKRITTRHLNCKLERVKDFQTLSARERYLKFITQNPVLALNVPVENIASFLGMEPQSLSRIRKQIIF
ncbi:MAG: Crp/Fnr family transcriptional regulator [Bacteroidota bacterium]